MATISFYHYFRGGGRLPVTVRQNMNEHGALSWSTDVYRGCLRASHSA